MIRSTKLDFYKTVKFEFHLEPYLYQINNFYDRSNVTKLRISAHELEIELGRRRGLARNLRYCKWCNISMGLNVVDDENHLLFHCDLHAEARQKIIRTIISLYNPHPQLNSNQLNFSDLILPNVSTWHPIPSSQNTSSNNNRNNCITEESLDHTNIHNSAIRGSPITTAQLNNAISKFITTCFLRRKKILHK